MHYVLLQYFGGILYGEENLLDSLTRDTQTQERFTNLGSGSRLAKWYLQRIMRSSIACDGEQFEF